jgi:hypothetical protein
VVTSEDSEEAKRKIDMFKRLKNEIQNDISVLKKHYQWIKNLEREILETNEVPLWVQ